MTGAEAVGVGLGFLAIVAPEFWPKMPRALSYTLAGIGLSWLTYSLILGIESLSHTKLQYGPLGIITIGAALIGLGLFWHIKRLGSGEPANDSHSQTVRSVTQPAPLLFNCQSAKLPTTVPAAGRVATMDIMSKLEFGAQALFLGTRDGEPGEKWTWFESDRELGGVSRCDITNYADFPIFNVAMNFNEEFRSVIVSKDNPGSTSAGELVETYDRPVVITNIDPKGTFSFYAYSQSKYFAMVSVPTEVTYLRAGGTERETAQLLPVGFMGAHMSFGPVKIKEKTLEAGPAPKSLPTPPPPTPSPPNKREKR